MPGYLDDYGQADLKRETRIKRIIIGCLSVAVIGLIAYLQFRNYREESRIKGFLAELRKQDYKAAYAFWGCTDAKPCRDYPFEKFLEDWGPKGVHAGLAGGRLAEGESCGTGYIGSATDGKDDVALWVETQNGTLGFAPWSECPEKRFRLMKWLRMRFGGA
jgi:hypothetical protein